MHKFAKKTLAAALRLKLPGLRESDGRNSLDVVHEGDFVFDSADLEKRHGEIVPDVVCKRAGRILHVEFLVTHACGPEKLARLRNLNVGSIEIDLSGYRDWPLDTLVEAILSEAPRVWLHNPKVSAAQSKLAEIERKRLEQVDFQARDLLAAAKEIARVEREVGEWEDGATEHGLGSAIATQGLAIGFLVREEEWKSFALIEYGLAAKNGFTRKEVFAAIKARGWIDQRFGFVSDEVAAGMRLRAARNIRVPWEAVGDFLASMQKSGSIIPIDRRGKLAGGKRLFDSVRHAKELKERPQKRTDELSSIVAKIISFVRENFREGFDFDTWLSRPDPAGAGAADFVLGDEDAWLEYLGKFERLLGEMSRRPPQVTDDLDLPVMREISARQEAHRLGEERRSKEAAEKAERDASDREASLLRSVEAATGDSAGAWMLAGCESLGGDSPAAMARRSQADFWKAVGVLDRWKEDMREQTRRENRREKAISSLRAAARTNFKRDDLAELWLRQPQRDLDGVRPVDHCVDDDTLATCVQLLPGKARR
ncbi:MAG: hypothetical protein L0I29_00685 [Hyphomicrobiales bacterium]|nr:hypothetical protein [Hyphomicrobiales bacterium]